jgi:hypothetical protein
MEMCFKVAGEWRRYRLGKLGWGWTKEKAKCPLVKDVDNRGCHACVGNGACEKSLTFHLVLL